MACSGVFMYDRINTNKGACNMGRFVNPSNSAFKDVLNSRIYVDKTEIIEYINSVIDTNDKFICNSRPRRFGKSVTADMLTAYYSKECNSLDMFKELQISKSESFEKHLNKYDVIHFDVQWCMQSSGRADKVVNYITKNTITELKKYYKTAISDDVVTLPEALSCINEVTGNKFIVIIDEWDVLIRDLSTDYKVQNEYINFLRGMFKGSEPSKYIHLAYLTGILPIKKIKTQSALNNFDEFTMLDARVFAKYIGFTQEEVKELCEKYNRDFDAVKRWYDGYILEDCQVYNPKAVVEVMTWNKFKSYWSQTGTYDAIVPLINMDFDGLRGDIIEMLSGESVKVEVTSFQNDMVSFKNKDDVLTYLIHIGYLGYNQNNNTTFIPNEELRQELKNATERKKWNELIELQKQSDELLEATLNMQEDIVAKKIEEIHTQYTSIIQYNNENSLSSILTIAYLSAMKYYFKPIRELPTGRGFADFVFIPKPEYIQYYPALIIELKWNKNASTAISQIKEKRYSENIKNYTGDILLVGINYDKNSKKHECIIENINLKL